MGKRSKDQDKKKRSTPQNVWRLILMVVGVVAVVQELQKAPEERTWHGTVASFVPYDFRMPTMDRVRDTYWNSDGPFLSSKVWGVGWAPNFGAVKRLLDR